MKLTNEQFMIVAFAAFAAFVAISYFFLCICRRRK